MGSCKNNKRKKQKRTKNSVEEIMIKDIQKMFLRMTRENRIPAEMNYDDLPYSVKKQLIKKTGDFNGDAAVGIATMLLIIGAGISNSSIMKTGIAENTGFTGEYLNEWSLRMAWSIKLDYENGKEKLEFMDKVFSTSHAALAELINSPMGYTLSCFAAELLEPKEFVKHKLSKIGDNPEAMLEYAINMSNKNK
ncbi:hypothetical protein V6C27_14210 [Peptococcaceae bacterium 1198_IL3148]